MDFSLTFVKENTFRKLESNKMKNKSNLSFIVLFGIAFLMVIASCKKDKENDNGQNNLENQFSVTLDYGDTYDYFWVVLCNLEGTEILDYKKLEGIGTADMISGIWAFYQSNELIKVPLK